MQRPITKLNSNFGTARCKGLLQRKFHRTRLEGSHRPAVSFVRAHYEKDISQKKAQPSSFPSASPSQTESRSLEATVMATAEKKRPRISSGAGRRTSRKEVHLFSLPQILFSLVGMQSPSSFFPAYSIVCSYPLMPSCACYGHG